MKEQYDLNWCKSGHGKVIADILMLSGEKEIIFWDDDAAAAIPGYAVYSPKGYNTEDEVILSIGNNGTRKKIADVSTYAYGKAIHQAAIPSADALISQGTLIMMAAFINSVSRIGKHCIINMATVIDHDVIVEDYAHISPNATLAGNVIVKEGVWVGAGAKIINQLEIGENTIIGDGAVVSKSLPANYTAIGGPAKPIKFHNK